MASWAKKGVECVCVARSWWVHQTGEKVPNAGPAYRETVVVMDVWVRPDDGRTVVRLKGHEGWFNVAGFRPMVRRTQEQDVALFASLLTETRRPALA